MEVDNNNFSDDEDYEFGFNEDNSEEGDEVPLLDISQSTGSFKSVDMEYDDTFSYKPDKKFLWEFPVKLENLFRPFDDRIIKLVQFTSNKVLDIICNLITFAVAIEILFATPVFLFFLGVDGLASEFTYIGLIAAFISQIPKRFIWRYRPWMVQRANKLRKASTSSFPSRAVCCSIIYSFAICYAYCYFTELQIVWWWMPELIIIMFLAASFARIFLGVHYPSDCVFGGLQGLLICLLGTFLWGADLLGCTSCRNDECYAIIDSNEQITGNSLSEMSYIPFIVVVIVSFILAILAAVKPIEFWRKADRSMGLLLPCVAFQVGFLCPNGSLDDGSLGEPLSPPIWYSYPVGIIIPLITILIGTKLKSKYPFISFTILYSIVLSSLIIWRLFIYPLDE